MTPARVLGAGALAPRRQGIQYEQGAYHGGGSSEGQPMFEEFLLRILKAAGKQESLEKSGKHNERWR
jgi:hypothetical protein